MKRASPGNGPEIGTAEAAKLLMLEGPAFLAIAREGWFSPLDRGNRRWRLADVVQGYIRFLIDREQYASTDDMAIELGIADSTVHLLRSQKFLPDPVGDKRRLKWPRKECRIGFARYQAETLKKKSAATAESRVRDARARDLELRTSIRMRELIPTIEAVESMDTVCGVTRTVLGGAPARISREVAVQRKAESVIDDCLNAISAELRRQADALKSGGDASGSAATIEPGPMGGEESSLSA